MIWAYELGSRLGLGARCAIQKNSKVGDVFRDRLKSADEIICHIFVAVEYMSYAS